MATMYVPQSQGGSGGSTIGTLMQLAGMFIPGAQFLSTLGQGLNAMSGMMQGNPTSLLSLLQGNSSGALGAMAQNANAGGMNNSGSKWINPAQGNLAAPIYEPSEDMINSLWSPAAIKALRGRGAF